MDDLQKRMSQYALNMAGSSSFEIGSRFLNLRVYIMPFFSGRVSGADSMVGRMNR